VGFSFLCSLTDSFSLVAVLLISLDKSRRAEVESERHTSPNAHTRERMGRPPVSFASTLHDMCSLTCLIGIDRKLSLLFTAALYVRRA
jgi:hypothetical protein